MGLFDYFRESGAGVTRDIQSITRTGAVTPPTTAPRVSTTTPSVTTTRRLPTLGEIGRRITTGYRVGRGEQIDVSRITPKKEVTPFKEYITAPIYQTATKLSADYQRWMSGYKGVAEVPEGVAGAVIEPLRRFGTGVVRTPGILAETAGMVPLGVEYIRREPYQAAAGVPMGLGVMAGGLETGIRERPYETVGELAGMALGPKVIGKVSPIKPVVVKVPVRPTLRSPYLPKVPTETITYRGLYAQLPLAKPKPLLGAVGVKPHVGAPRIEVARGYMPITKVETAVVLPSIKSRLAPLEAKRLELGLELMERLHKEKPITLPTPEQIQSAKRIPSLKFGEEKVLKKAFEPVFREMGIKPIHKKGIGTQIAPETVFEIYGATDARGFYSPATRQIVLRESGTPAFSTSTFPHEVGHVVTRTGGGAVMKQPPLLKRAVYEASAMKMGREIGKKFEDIYGYKGIEEIPVSMAQLKRMYRISPEHAMGEVLARTPLPLTKIKPEFKLSGLDVIGEVKYIPKKATPVVEKWLQSRESVIYGSATQKAQMMKGRIPADIDVAVKNPRKAAIELESQLKTVLGEKVRRRGNTIEVYENKGWHHAVDIHSIEHIKGLLEYGFETQPPIKIAGQQYMTLGEQFTRKGRSILAPGERTVDPLAHRMKDIPDFANIAQSLIESKKARAESSLLFKRQKISTVLKAEQLLTEFKETRGAGAPKVKTTPPHTVKTIGKKTPHTKRTPTIIHKDIIEKPSPAIELVSPTKEYPQYKPTKTAAHTYPITPKIPPPSVELYPSTERHSVSDITKKHRVSDIYPTYPVSGMSLLIPQAEVEIPYIPTYPREPDDQYLAAVVSPPYTPPTTPPYKPVIVPPYTPTVTPPYTPPTYPLYTPPTYPPPEAPVYHIPPGTPPPTTKLPLKPKKAKPEKKIGYHDPRYWPIQNPVSDLWGMLGIKMK